MHFIFIRYARKGAKESLKKLIVIGDEGSKKTIIDHEVNESKIIKFNETYF